MGRYMESLEDFTKSLELNPNYIVALANCGLNYQSLGRYEESIKHLNEALGIKSNNSEITDKYKSTSMKFGTCAKCKHNTGFKFCHNCDIGHEWSSKNDEMDKFIKDAQKKTEYYNKIIDWIPFERLENIKCVDNGGFGTIYSAIWTDGKRKYISENKNIITSREQYCTVALKSLKVDNSQEFLKEVKTFYIMTINVVML